MSHLTLSLKGQEEEHKGAPPGNHNDEKGKETSSEVVS